MNKVGGIKNQAPLAGEFLLYETSDGRTRVECRFVEDTLWLTQALMAELFQKDVRTVIPPQNQLIFK